MLKRLFLISFGNVRVVVSANAFRKHISFYQPDQVVICFYSLLVELSDVVFSDFSQILRSQTIASEHIG
jgi:hypothetical protein